MLDGEVTETLDSSEGPIGGDVNETFDNMDYESEESKALGENFKETFKERIDRAKESKKATSEDEKEEPKKQEKKESKKEKDKKKSDLDTLEDDLDLDKTKEEKKSEDKKEDKEDEQDDPEKAKEEEKPETKSKKLKVRMSDGLYGIESDATIRHKVDGEFQEIPVQELLNNYSGKVAWDKKFSEIGNEKKEVESLRAEVESTKNFLSETVKEVIGHLNDPEKNPLDALYFLVEKSGQDNYSVYKRMLEANLDEVENLMSMSEVERKAYFLEKKDEFRTKSEEARKAASAQEEAFNQAIQRVDELRKAHEVSEEQYLQALDELESQGLDTSKISDEQVVDYASLKPHVNDVQDVLEPYEDSIDDSKYSEIVQDFAKQLRAKAFTKEQLSELVRKEFMDEDLKDLQSRTSEVPKRTTPKAPVKTPEKIETLDFDFD